MTVSRLHRDVNNRGLSALMLAGRFSGGARKVMGGTELHLSECEVLLIFSGQDPHMSLPFKGNRGSLIFFSHATWGSLPAGDAAALSDAGFRLPEARTSVERPLDKPLRVAYLFSGAHRRSSVAESLFSEFHTESFAGRFSCIEVYVFDTLNDPISHDLIDSDRQASYEAQTANGEYAAVFVTPPCSSWSRATWANDNGPKSVRSRQYPLGFPWLSGRALERATVGNLLVFFSLRILHAIIFARSRGCCTCGLLEHRKI